MTREPNHPSAARSQRTRGRQHLSVSPPPHLLRDSMVLSKLRKEQLQEKLAELGETAPSRWTKKEIIQRILEIDPEADKAPSKQRTDLQTRIKDLGVASRKKSTLVEYCQSIGLGVEPNDTIYRLEQRALRRLYDVSDPAAEDVVGFGRHSTETYQEILVQRPTYAMWVKQTAAETSETDYRLRRLANWLEQQSTEEAEMVRAPKEKIKAKAKAVMPPPSTAQSSSDNTAVMIQSLLETVQGLQQEVQEMRAERPRKEVRAPPSETDESKSSYQMVESRPKSK